MERRLRELGDRNDFLELYEDTLRKRSDSSDRPSPPFTRLASQSPEPVPASLPASGSASSGARAASTSAGSSRLCPPFSHASGNTASGDPRRLSTIPTDPSRASTLGGQSNPIGRPAPWRLWPKETSQQRKERKRRSKARKEAAQRQFRPSENRNPTVANARAPSTSATSSGKSNQRAFARSTLPVDSHGSQSHPAPASPRFNRRPADQFSRKRPRESPQRYRPARDSSRSDHRSDTRRRTDKRTDSKGNPILTAVLDLVQALGNPRNLSQLTVVMAVALCFFTNAATATGTAMSLGSDPYVVTVPLVPGSHLLPVGCADFWVCSKNVVIWKFNRDKLGYPHTETVSMRTTSVSYLECQRSLNSTLGYHVPLHISAKSVQKTTVVTVQKVIGCQQRTREAKPGSLLTCCDRTLKFCRTNNSLLVLWVHDDTRQLATPQNGDLLHWADHETGRPNCGLATQIRQVQTSSGPSLWVDLRSGPAVFWCLALCFTLIVTANNRLHQIVIPFIFLALAARVTATGRQGAAPMCCQTHEGKQVFSLPQRIHCNPKEASRDVSEKLVPVRVQLFKRNHIQYRSEGFICKKVRTTVKSLTYFFDDEHLRNIEKHGEAVSSEECEQMRRWKTCKQGSLTVKGDLWQTSFQPDWTYPGGGTSCCYWKVSEVTNCYLYKAVVYKRHIANYMESTAGVVSHCNYREGKCQLKDGSFLLWTPDKREHCEFLEWKEITGRRLGQNWLSNDGDLALTHADNLFTKDCKGRRIRMSDQGIPFVYLKQEPAFARVIAKPRNILPHRSGRRRVRRDSPTSNGGPVPSEILAASLQAVTMDLQEYVSFAFEQAMSSTCRTMTDVLKILAVSVMANPTLAMRTLLQRDDILARAGGNAIEVWPCSVLQPGSYHFLPMNGSCTTEIPIQFALSGEVHHGYMDPRTNIITKNGYPSDCTMSEEVPLKIGNATVLYRSDTGELIPAPDLTPLEIVQWNASNLAPSEPTIFHQIVMYNWTELQSRVTLNDVLGTLSAQQQIFAELGVRDHRNPTSAARQAIAGVMSRGMFGFLWGFHIDPMQVWVFCCCAVVTFTVAIKFCCPSALSGSQFGASTIIMPLVHRIQDAWNRGGMEAVTATHSAPPETEMAATPVRPPPEYTAPPPAYHTTVEQRHGSSGSLTQVRVVPSPPMGRRTPLIKPRTLLATSMTIMFLLASCFTGATGLLAAGVATLLPGREQEWNTKYSPLLQVKLNGMPCEALVDTGSGLSMISEPLASTLKLKLGPITTTASSVSQHRLPLLGSASVFIRVGGKCYRQRVHVLKNSPSACFLGTDFLRAVGKVSFDFNAHTVQFGARGVQVPFVQPPPDRWRVCIPEINLVSGKEYIELHSRKRYFLEAVVERAPSELLQVMLEPNPWFFAKTGVFVVRTFDLLKNGTIRVQLTNPQRTPVRLYPGTCIGTAELAVDQKLVGCVDQHAVKNPAEPHFDIANQVDWTNSDLNQEQKARLTQLLRKYPAVFAKDKFDLGRTNLIQHHINTGDQAPIRSQPYRIPPHKQPMVKEHIGKMLAHNIIQPSVSPWAHPIVMVAKKNGEQRFCVDYRGLNRITKRDEHPLPRIDDILERLGKGVIFSSLDMASGYWQVELHPETREKTAFSSMFGLYEFLVLPFGLTNVPPGFQRLMDFVLTGLNWECATVYLDDVLVYSPSFDQHLVDLEAVLKRFRKHGLKLKPSKCSFGCSSVEFLGHVVSKDGIRPNPAKVKAVREFPVPKNPTQVRQFLGLASFYRRFVPGFATMAKPLHNLTTKELKFVWTPLCQRAMDSLKDALTTEPILAYPDFTKPFILSTDASNVGLGACLSQIGRDGQEHPIAYASRVISKTENRYGHPTTEDIYGTPEKEALAIVWSIQHFRHFLHDSEFSIKTDHSPLRWLMSVRNPSDRLRRWGLMIQQYNITNIDYIPGARNKVPDALSRNPVTGKTDMSTQTDSIPLDFALAASAQHLFDSERTDSSAGAIFPGIPHNCRLLQRQDSALNAIIRYLEDGTQPADPAEARKIQKLFPHYAVSNSLLYHLPKPSSRFSLQFPSQLVIPKVLVPDIMEIYHDDLFSGHLGPDKTLQRIQMRFFWEGMTKQVSDYCHQCRNCQTRKPPHQYFREELVPIPITGAFDRVNVDVVGPLHKTLDGNRYIVVFVDALTKWPEAFAVPEVSSETIARLFVEQLVCRHGAPMQLLSDRGSNFMSQLLRDVCALCNTRKVQTTPYHPAGNGQVENFNKTLGTMLSMYASARHDDWDRALPMVLFAYRSSGQTSTKETPAFLLYGRDLRMPADIAFQFQPSPYRNYDETYPELLSCLLTEARELARQHLETAQTNQKKQHDRLAHQRNFDVGDWVYIMTPKQKKGLSKKLLHLWHGPYEITKIERPRIWVKDIDSPEKTQGFDVHISRVKKASKGFDFQGQEGDARTDSRSSDELPLARLKDPQSQTVNQPSSSDDLPLARLRAGPGVAHLPDSRSSDELPLARLKDPQFQTVDQPSSSDDLPLARLRAGPGVAHFSPISGPVSAVGQPTAGPIQDWSKRNNASQINQDTLSEDQLSVAHQNSKSQAN